jgi:deoxycytidine triphosphate deaminase
MRTLQDSLRWSLRDRCDAFERQIDRQRAGLGGSNPPGMVHALDLFAAYVPALKAELVRVWDETSEDFIRLSKLRHLMAHLQARIELYDDRFSRTYERVPRSLMSLVEKECADFGLASREAVLTVGPPGNFATFVADLKLILFRDLGAPDLPDYLQTFNPVMIAIPDMEGTRATWQPVVIGHELAHYFQRSRPIAEQINLQDNLDAATLAEVSTTLPRAAGVQSSDSRLLRQIAARWLNEFICDAYAVHRYGAAGVTALCEFLESVGSANFASRTHPPGSLRALLLLRFLGEELSEAERRMTAPFAGLGDMPREPRWASYLSQVFGTLSSDIQKAVETWSPFPSYHSRQRSQVVEWLAEQFDLGIPGRESAPLGKVSARVEAADVVNASWLARVDETDKPIDRLAAKALDNLDFLEKWSEAGGSPVASDPDPVSRQVSHEELVLSELDILARLDMEDETAIRVTPRLPGSVRGSSMDVRLGNQFIIFQQSATSSFDALSQDQDPRSMQLLVEKAWGDTFHLHPGQLVLASTLEYIALPPDLSAQVGTRSSYGRLGLISATAVQIHPLFVGCLTLELINLGEMPLTITPGERIAQLVFMRTTAPASGDVGKYQYPTGPEFSRIRGDIESGVLRRMRDQHQARRQSLRDLSSAAF